MSYSVLQTRRFAKQYKKLHNNTAAVVDQAVIAIANNPEIGERKKGDLATLYVYKFRAILNLIPYPESGIFLLNLSSINAIS